ncbi:MAG: DNA mismatch repair endonuclease MutL [Clostridiales bacterium]|nr:DNA mismatch repair endonuclease MutL [Clostridiales bacterium]
MAGAERKGGGDVAKINVLGKDVYSLIAAGEVAERPMSVVKEMVENSIDAKAENITVEIKNGGTTYIRITDDGTGILRDDVRNVFTPHATSKIANKDDLDAIGTLGFRGEAMASIAAVSKIEMMTRAGGESMGVRYEIAAGAEQLFEDAGCPLGTTIVVRDIFYNVPARMKFLKKDVTEGNSVQGVVERIALSHPEISIRFIRDGRQVLITSGNGSLKDCIYSVLGQEISESLIEVDYSLPSMKVQGFVSKPHASRKSRAMQFFYVNGRYVKSRTAMAALEQAYKNVIMTGRYPACVLNVSLDLPLVDVNVHPSKIEVRFVNERSVFNLIYYGVKTAIESRDTVKEGKFDMPKQPPTGVHSQSIKLDIFKKQPEARQMKFTKSELGEVWQVAAPADYDGGIELNMGAGAPIQGEKTAEPAQSPKQPGAAVITEDGKTQDIKIIGEAFSTYIIVQRGGELYYIDKHAAHERMNYERLREDAASGVPAQVLLQSVAVRLSGEEYSAVTENLDLINKCGFLVEDFGNMSVIVREAPALLDGADINDLIVEIAKKLTEHKTDIEPDKMDWIFHSASCRGAVKAGDRMSAAEMQLFVNKLFSMPNIRYCPHGRPVMIKISRHELEKQFGRVQ